MERPAFKPHYLVLPIDEEGVVLLSERRRILLRGRLVAHLAPLLDGTRTMEAIVLALRDEATRAEIIAAVESLARKGHLHDQPSIPWRESAYWTIQDTDAPPRSAEVHVEVAGDLDRGMFVNLLEQDGLRVSGEATFTIVFADDYLRSTLRDINGVMLAAKRPWMLVKPIGVELWIGPLFRPDETACWECLATRLRENREVESFAAARSSVRSEIIVSRAATPASLATAAHLAVTQAARFIATGSALTLTNAVATMDLLTLSSRSHAVVRRPQCEACGTRDTSLSRAGLPIHPGSPSATDPETTVARLRHLISPITGVVSSLEDAGALVGPGAHVTFAGHNFARQASSSVDALRASLRSQSSGKGTSVAQARASGLCEALERASGVFEEWEPRRRARYSEVRDVAVHPHSLLLFSDRQYDARDDRDDRELPRRVPVRFDEDRAVDWTAAWSLTDSSARMLPTAYCYYRYPVDAGHTFCHADSNGCAAGNTIEEAILQGFFEVVERDAVAIWWYNRARRPAVDIAAFDDPYLTAHADMLRALDREMWVLDLTSDFAVPTMAAISRRLEGPEEILLGFGAHWNPRIATLRAVTELNQMIAWTKSAHGRGIDALPDSPTLRWLRGATIAENPYLAPARIVAPRAPDRDLWSDDIGANVRRSVEEVKRRGREMIVLDQTRPDIGLPVAKVIIPGMRHFWARFGAGRLYDVPVALGWTERAVEEQLNPVELVL